VRRLGLVIFFGLLSACGGSGSPGTLSTPTASTPTASTPTASTPTTPATTPPPTPVPSRTSTAKHLRYTFPVAGCSASPSSGHHDYPASDIFTQKGCRFVAVVAGRVDEVSYADRWSPSNDGGAVRGGRSVSVVGDDGVRYYGSHLLKIAAGISPGARVRAGQTLGLIDNSGDARYTPTHVHFGLSWPTRPGTWWVRRGMVWPQRYLAAWRNGQDLSPAAEVRRVHARDGEVPRCTAEC
jgi:peptidoglycan LD-endopeptidase LytH